MAFPTPLMLDPAMLAESTLANPDDPDSDYEYEYHPTETEVRVSCHCGHCLDFLFVGRC